MKPVSTEHFTVQETPPFGGFTLRIILASHPGILIGPYATPDPRDPTNPRDILGPVLQNWIVNLFDHVPAGFHGTLQILEVDVSFPRGDQLPSLRCQSVSLVPTIFSRFLHILLVHFDGPVMVFLDLQVVENLVGGHLVVKLPPEICLSLPLILFHFWKRYEGLCEEWKRMR